jgi:hypothetical protein
MTSRTRVNHHVERGDHVEVYVQSIDCMTVSVGMDSIGHEIVLFANPWVMVELLSTALTHAQQYVDSMGIPQDDASRPGPGTRSVKRSVLGAGASTALPESCMAEGG